MEEDYQEGDRARGEHTPCVHSSCARARARVCLSVCVCPHPLSVGLILLQSVGVAAVALAPALFDFLGLVHTIDPVG